jgi:hypothetical protein
MSIDTDRARYCRAAHTVAAFFTSLLFLVSPASATVTLFENVGQGAGVGTSWCDPCSTGNVGYRVWDSFTLGERSTLQFFRWIGLRTDPLTLGVDFEIASNPYVPPIFSAHFASGDITMLGDTGFYSNIRRISLPNIVLNAGTYWLTVHGPSNSEEHTWLGVHEPNGDNSLLQFGPDPNNPTRAYIRNQDAVFRLAGLVTPIPEPSTWSMLILGFAALGCWAGRRKKRMGESLPQAMGPSH